MPDPKIFNMDFRPESYWDNSGDYYKAAAKVKRKLCRQTAKSLDKSDLHNQVICTKKLPEEHRFAAGRIHPMFMSGESLPDLYSNEVEIARVTLKSVMMDIISIRARRKKNRIFYRIVDEYEGKGLFSYHLIQKTSTKPLTMKHLIRLIDNANENGGLISNARQMNYEVSGDLEELYDFATISSGFYPELTLWYDQVNEEWLNERLYEQTGKTKAERLEEEFRDNYLKRKRPISAQAKEWRKKNKKELEIERREIELIQLHSEYEKRYKLQNNPQSEDEIAWRAQNEDRLKAERQFKRAVASCMTNAEWQMRTGMGGAYGAAIVSGCIKRYIENYLKSNCELPYGEHTVQGNAGADSFNIKVTFKRNVHI